MKNNKLNKIWIAGLAALVILILLLTMCTGPKKEETVETLPTETAEQQLAAPTEQTRQPAETTAPTEETTEPTEETTEPTEETTAPTTGSNDSGSGGGSTTPTNPTEPPLEVPEAGTEKNPYLEVVSDYPGKVSTVNIPGKGEISYLISGSAGNILTIHNANAKVVCGEKTYAPDADGILTVDMSELTADAVISITNAGEEELVYELLITEPLGAKTNPVIIADISAIDVALKAGDADGNFYKWTATATGTLTLSVKPEEVISGETEQTGAAAVLTALMDALNVSNAEEMTDPVSKETAAEAAEEPADDATDEELETQETETPEIEVIVTVGEKTFKLSESQTGSIVLDVAKQEEVLIQVMAIPDEEGTYPEVSAQLIGSFAIKPGTEENPYEHTLTAVPESFTTVEIPAESQVYYRFIGAEGTVLTIADQACVILENVTYGPTVNDTVWVELPAEEAEAIVLAVGNQNTEAKALTLNFAYKGSVECPAILSSIESIDAALEESDADGYFYQWTADDPGTVSFVLDSIAPESAAYDVTLSVAGTDRSTKFVDGAASIELKAGETLIIHVAAQADEDGAYPAISLKLSSSFTPAPGTSADNPLVISDTGVPTAITVGAEKTFYISGSFHGQSLTIWDAADAVLGYNGQTISSDEFGTLTLSFPKAEGEAPEPITFTLTSNTASEYTLEFSYPLGTAQNPALMVLEENQAVLEANDADGYSFAWYGDIEGELTITMPEDDNWQYTLDGVTHTSAEEPKRASVTIQITEGQEILFTVNTFDPDSDGTPAGTVTFTVSFYDPTLGTEENPIYLELTDTITIPAGQTVYYTARVDGMTMTLTGENVKLTHNGVEYTPLDGVMEIACKGKGMMQPPVFAITNTAEEETTCTVEFTYALGHQENPAQLKLGETKITLEAGDEDGYCFLWKAEESGTFTITMAEGKHWQYVVNNLTSFVSGELHVSNDDPLVLSETITVSTGDEIRIIVNTYDPEMPFSTPGGEITFVTAFAAKTAE